MSSQLPPTRPGLIPQNSTFHEPSQQEQYYPPEQGKLPPPPPSEKRGIHSLLRNWPWIVAIISALMIGYGAGNYMGQATPPTVIVQPESTIQATPATENSAQALPTNAPTTPAQIIQPTPTTGDSAQATPTSAPTTQSQ